MTLLEWDKKEDRRGNKEEEKEIQVNEEGKQVIYTQEEHISP